MSRRESPSPWRGRISVAALAIIVVSALWRAAYVAGSFFNQDDYVAMAWVKEYGFGWDYLMIQFAGHVNPGQRLLYYLVVQMSPMSWVPPAAVIDLAMLAGTVLMWCVLVRLVGKRGVALFGLLLFSLAPMLLVVGLWFGAALATWPLLLSGLGAVLLFLRWHQGARGGSLNVVLVPLVMALGLVFHERSLLVAPLVFGVAMLVGGPDDEPQGPLRTLRRFWLLWVGMTVVAGSYLGWYLTRVDMGGGVSPSNTDNLKLVAWFLGRAVAPGLVSGPWDASRNGGAIVPATWVVVVVNTVILLMLVVAVWRGGRVGRLGVLFLVGYALIEAAILLVSRGGYGAVIALDPRYSADMILPATLVLVVVLARKRGPWFELRRPVPRNLARGMVPAVVVGCVVGSVVTVAVLGPDAQNREDRTFITNIRQALQSDPRIVLIDRQVPAGIVIGVFGEYTALSRVLSPLPEDPLFDEPSEHLKVVADNGRVLDPMLFAPATAEGNKRRACRFAVTAKPTALRLDDDVSGDVLVRVDYFTNISGRLTMRLGSGRVVLPVREGANRVQAVVDAGDRPTRTAVLRADQFGATSVCVTQLAVGAPEVP